MESVYLRSLEFGDLERTYQWHNDPSIYQTMLGSFHYVSHSTEEEWLRTKQAYSAQEINLAICLSGSSQHIGNIYLRQIDWISRNGEVGIFIGESEQHSKGFGQTAMHLLIHHAFQDLGLVRIYGYVFDDNKPTLRLNEKCGFKLEGKLRKHAFKNGEFKDVLVMGLCVEDLATTDLL
jgi:RimJ/RimL family protein N-acetyltransferase